MASILTRGISNPFSIFTQVTEGVDNATELYTAAKATLAGLSISAAGSLLLLGSATGMLIEGVALVNAKELSQNQETSAKIVKYALAAFAILGALIATANLGVFVGFMVNTGITYLISGEIVYGGSSLAIGSFTGALLAIGTLPIHWKAFQWAGLVPNQNSAEEVIA